MSMVGYFIRETFISLRRNVMMTISGIITIAICATIVTSSLLFIRGNDRAAAEQRAGVELEIFMKVDAAKGDVAAMSDALDEAKTQQQIRSFKYLDHKAAFEVYKRLSNVRDAPDLVTGVKPAQIPESFRVTLTKAIDVDRVGRQFDDRPGVLRLDGR